MATWAAATTTTTVRTVLEALAHERSAYVLDDGLACYSPESLLHGLLERVLLDAPAQLIRQPDGTTTLYIAGSPRIVRDARAGQADDMSTPVWWTDDPINPPLPPGARWVLDCRYPIAYTVYRVEPATNHALSGSGTPRLKPGACAERSEQART